MSRIDADELNAELDMEYWLSRESRPYRLGRGVSGPQLNIQTCPNPECGDRRWRTYLGVDSGRGNCFVCNETFTNLTFIRMALGEPPWRDVFKHVKETLAEQGWRPKRTVTAAVENGPVTLPASHALPNHEGRNLVYLDERGIGADIAAYFHLRFCAFGWWRYKRPDGTPSGQNFSDRVIIPVYDLEGKLTTFQGRDVTGKGDPKYLFPSGLPGTGRYLLNGQNAWRAKRIVMGEGFFDVAAIKIALDDDVGLRDVAPVGSFGKHLSYGSPDGEDQLGAFRQLKTAGLEEVTFMWDGEPDALKAALAGADLLHKMGLRARIALLPAGKDPNEIAAVSVREAFYKAVTYDRALAVRWMVRNPYKSLKTAEVKPSVASL